MKNILFICSANKDRSKTAEDYFSEQYSKFQFDSAGTNKKICQQLGSNYIAKEQLDWADKIVVMEQKHANAIKEIFSNNYFNKIEVLDIKDKYTYGSSDLIKRLKNKASFLL